MKSPTSKVIHVNPNGSSPVRWITLCIVLHNNKREASHTIRTLLIILLLTIFIILLQLTYLEIFLANFTIVNNLNNKECVHFKPEMEQDIVKLHLQTNFTVW